ncbi:FAD-dependent oxidoreductase [uncultured Brevundimonas sp.]|uniref:NAD(P)/FAD-dependent oxidoreductase n=1 Tax=uncultured Brevundimonas sp. TaxID=213418 RepID=UPI0030EDFE0E|tara:strand:- start:155998 stop:157125 length:1128 start_codon:yes stop_codon:yes gene_type:complete
MRTRRLVLVGAGHAHLHLVRQAAQLCEVGLEVTLIAPRRFQYSGLASGVLSGALAVEAAEIDVVALASAFRVRHLSQPVTAIDRTARVLTLAGGATEPFDLLSLNIGSVAADPYQLATQAGVWPVKPLANLFALRTRIEADSARDGASPRIVVAGGGQSALEITASLCGLQERQGVRPDVTLVAPAFGATLPPAALARLTKSLAARGVAFRSDTVVGREPQACCLADGGALPCDVLVLAAGLAAPPLIADLALPVDESGRLLVAPTLQSVDDPTIFAAGDCAVIRDHPRPAAGVFGVRAAPVLLDNLTALSMERPLRSWRPQRRWLSIMDLGDGRGLAIRGGFWSLGRTSLRLKRYLDLGFVRRMRADPVPRQET